jgi:hypothetical protein
MRQKQRMIRDKEIYDLRKKYRYKWEILAKRFGLTTSGAVKAARKHAHRNQLRWPLKRATKEFLCYELRAAGHTWTYIRLEFGISSNAIAARYAKRWAKKHHEPWPLPLVHCPSK